MTFAYFCLSALDLLQQVHDVVDEKERNEYIDWVYDQQMCKLFGEPGIYRKLRIRAEGFAVRLQPALYVQRATW